MKTRFALAETGFDYAGVFAECSFVPFVDRTEYLGKGRMFTKFPKLDARRTRLKSRPAYQQAIPPEDKRLHLPVH